MSLPRVVAVTPGSAAARAGLLPGDQILAMGGRSPRDIIEYRLLADEAALDLDVERGGLALTLLVEKEEGEPLGAEVSSALFDRVQTCDNHCEFCFIYQLPKGMRKSLYLKDDDYRLSFLYGNFTTLTRFTEADLERVVTEGLSPLYVSIHATDPAVRSQLLRNPRGAVSLRWLRALLDAGIVVHGQIVVCPGINDGAVLEDTLAGVLDEYPELATVAAGPLGISRYTPEGAMRSHTRAEAEAVVDTIEGWQTTFVEALGRRVAWAADEYYLLACRSFPPAETYEGFLQHENGIGMARLLLEEAEGRVLDSDARHGQGVGGFFQSVDGAPAAGYRAERGGTRRRGAVTLLPSRRAPIAILTGTYGAAVLAPLIDGLPRDDVRLLPVTNEFFGGNIGVTGLLVGEDLARTLYGQPEGHRYLLPDVCLNEGRFLDGLTPADLPRPVENVTTNGRALMEALKLR